MSNIVEFHGVCKRYDGGRDALSDVSFVLGQGELAFLTGHSGAGKSTLLKLIALIERPTRGQIIVNGKNLATIRRGQIPRLRQGLGIIFQNYALLNDRSVFDNVAMPLIFRGMTQDVIGRRVRGALDIVGLLHKERAMPLTLSGGEQQRVGIARAVVSRPQLLLADEPTANLDPDLAVDIMRLFGRLNEVGVSVLVASHAFELIARMKRRIVHLEEGKVISQSPAAGAP
jgi:cell division transport system ATP-binding protein